MGGTTIDLSRKDLIGHSLSRASVSLLHLSAYLFNSLHLSSCRSLAELARDLRHFLHFASLAECWWLVMQGMIPHIQLVPPTSTTNIPNLSTSAKSSQKWFKTPSKSSNPSKWPVALPYIDFGKPAPVNGQMPRTKLSYEVRNPKS